MDQYPDNSSSNDDSIIIITNTLDVILYGSMTSPSTFLLQVINLKGDDDDVLLFLL